MNLLPVQHRFTLPEKIIFSVSSIFISIFLIIRAYKVQMGHDELATFYYYIQSGRFFTFFTISDTNNHFLNSLLTWISYKLLGDSPVALRLPNLLFIPVYLYSILEMSRFLKSAFLRLILFISLVFTLHLVEFLALSRGYGMSFSMLLISFLFTLRWLNTRSNKDLIISMTGIFLASLANLSMIFIYPFLLIFMIFINLRDAGSRTARFFLTITFLGIIPFLIVLAQILYIKSESGLVAGNLNGFWTTSMLTMISMLFETDRPFSDLIPIVLMVLIVVSYLLIYLKTRNINKVLASPFFLFGYLLLASICSLIILGQVFHINYPDDRIATFMYILLILSVVFCTDQLFGLYQKRTMLLIAAPLILIPVHFLYFANTAYSSWYRYDIIPKRYYDKVMKNLSGQNPAPTVGAHGLRILCWSYLTYRNDGDANAVFFTTYPSYIPDFLIVNINEFPLWSKYYDTLDFDKISKRYLLKLKRSPHLTELAIFDVPSKRNYSDEFLIFSEGDAKPWRGKVIQADIDLAIHSIINPFHSRVVVDIYDKDYKSLRYEYLQLNWIRPGFPATGKRLINTILVDRIPEEATGYKVYLWNIDRTNYEISGRVSVKERNVE